MGYTYFADGRRGSCLHTEVARPTFVPISLRRSLTNLHSRSKQAHGGLLLSLSQGRFSGSPAATSHVTARTYAEVREVRPYLQKPASRRGKRYFVWEAATCFASFVLVLVLVLLPVFGLGLGQSVGRHTSDLPTFCLERMLTDPLFFCWICESCEGGLRWGETCLVVSLICIRF